MNWAHFIKYKTIKYTLWNISSLPILDQYSAEGWTACQDCPAGHSCASAADTPVKCSGGEYSPAASKLKLFLYCKSFWFILWILTKNFLFLRHEVFKISRPLCDIDFHIKFKFQHALFLFKTKKKFFYSTKHETHVLINCNALLFQLWPVSLVQLVIIVQ